MDNNLYLNITNKCSNNCWFCIRNFKQGVAGFNLKLTRDPSAEEIISALSKVLNLQDWESIVFCGFGEPTSRLDVLLEVARWIRKNYKRQVELRVDTNGHGYKLNPERDVAQDLVAAGITKVSVSLNAGDKETYNEICRPTFENAYEAVQDFICRAKMVLQVEATVVRMPEVNVEKAKIAAEKLGVPLKIREYNPCFF
jgi:GTP 3',8-cyclase